MCEELDCACDCVFGCCGESTTGGELEGKRDGMTCLIILGIIFSVAGLLLAIQVELPGCFALTAVGALMIARAAFVLWRLNKQASNILESDGEHWVGLPIRPDASQSTEQQSN